MDSFFDPNNLTRGCFTYFPVAAGRAEFAVEVRQAILKLRPRVVALELPGCFEVPLRQALNRLPELSVILSAAKDDDQFEGATYFPVEPTDPFIEAARTAREAGAELMFLEPDVNDRPHVSGRYPDTYAIRHIGISRYLENYRLFPQPRSRELETHAAAMAWKLQGADPDAGVLVVVSLNLLDPLLDAMEQPQPEPERSRLGVKLLNAHPDCLA